MIEAGGKNFVLEDTVLGSDEPGKGPGYTHSFHPNTRTSAPQDESWAPGAGSHYSGTAVEVGLMEDCGQVVMMCANGSYFQSSAVD